NRAKKKRRHWNCSRRDLQGRLVGTVNAPHAGRKSITRRSENLNRNYATIHKRYRLGRISYPWRKVRIVEWIEEGISNDGEAMVTMMVKDNGAAEVSAISIGAIRIGIRRVCVAVIVVNPCLHGPAPSSARGLLI